MTSDQVALLDKAHRSHRAALLLEKSREHDFATSRAYYSMFYAAQAVLLDRGLSFSSHSAVIAAFGREFAKTGILPRELHRHLIEAEEARNIGDYQLHQHVTEERAKEHLTRAEEFIQRVEDLLT